MGTVVNNLAKGGGEPKGFRDVLQVGGVGTTSLWVRCLVDDPPHDTGHWGVSM